MYVITPPSFYSPCVKVLRPKTSPASFTPVVMTSKVPLLSSCSDKMFPAFGFGAQIPPDYKVTLPLAVSQHALSCLPPLLPPWHVRVLLDKHPVICLKKQEKRFFIQVGQVRGTDLVHFGSVTLMEQNPDKFYKLHLCLPATSCQHDCHVVDCAVKE